MITIYGRDKKMSWIDNLVTEMAQEEIDKAKRESKREENKHCKDCGYKMNDCAKLWKDQRKCCPDCKCVKFGVDYDD